MEPWKAVRCPSDEGDYVLRNPSQTLLRFSRRVSPDVRAIMAELRRMRVPFAYSNQVKEIYFTILSNDSKHVVHGDHLNGKIRVSVGKDSRGILPRILVHELAHCVDDEEGISERPEIVAERKEGVRNLPDPQDVTSILEYVAVGFEAYYCDPAERRKLRLGCPRLYQAILKTHRKYRAR